MFLSNKHNYDKYTNRVSTILGTGGDHNNPSLLTLMNIGKQGLIGGSNGVIEYKKQVPVIGGGNVEIEGKDRHNHVMSMTFDHPVLEQPKQSKETKSKKVSKQDLANQELNDLLKNVNK